MRAPSEPLFSVDELRAIERDAAARLPAGDPGLMARAGAAAWRRARARWPEARRIAVCAGPGNNGGDGYVVARLAREAGCEVVVLANGAPRADDARAAAQAWTGETRPWSAAGDALATADLVVDAMFGIGLARDPDSDAAALIAALNAARGAKLALDVPSGLDADRGHAHAPCVRADLTVTFLAHKRGLWTGDAFDVRGDLVLETLGVATPASSGAKLLDAGIARVLLPRRAPSTHKGRVGHVLVVGGARGLGGAALLAAEAAARAGAGLVSLATDAAHVAAALARRPELMAFDAGDPSRCNDAIGRATWLVVGPGLGQGEWGAGLLARALAAGKPAVLDADALNRLAAASRTLPSGCVLTPHPGEAARLLGSDVAAVQRDRCAAALAIAGRHGAVVVLKGAGTVVASPDGALAIGGGANPAMASGGIGDVLAGVVAAFAAQGLAPFDAACAGVAAHAEAARRAARGLSRGLLAADVAACIAQAVGT